MAVPRGIEPLFPGGKPGVLTDRRRDRAISLYRKIINESRL